MRSVKGVVVALGILCFIGLFAGVYATRKTKLEVPIPQVPTDVPDTVLLNPKHGHPREVSGPELYSDGYRTGWRTCMKWEEHGWLDSADEKIDAMRLTDENEIFVRGWMDGFEACRQSILR